MRKGYVFTTPNDQFCSKRKKNCLGRKLDHDIKVLPSLSPFPGRRRWRAGHLRHGWSCGKHWRSGSWLQSLGARPEESFQNSVKIHILQTGKRPLSPGKPMAWKTGRQTLIHCIHWSRNCLMMILRNGGIFLLMLIPHASGHKNISPR